MHEQIYFSGGDIDTAFYRMSAPKWAKKFFTLPPIKAKYLGVSSVNGVAVGPEDYITPVLEVLPMGWSWALWICQMIHEQSAREAGLDRDHIVSDRSPSLPLLRSNF